MKNYKETTNAIVPFGFSVKQPERVELLHFITEKCLREQTAKNLRLILIESSQDPTQSKYAKTHFDEYHFLPTGKDEFGPGKVQNAGFELSTPSSHTYIHQADFLINKNGVRFAKEIMTQRNAQFEFLYFFSINFSKPITE